MSRSQPTDNSPNLATRWYEWDGANGNVRYYDKSTKKQVAHEKEFVFILLDQTATIKGWHDPSESGIYSNEVRDTRAERFVVKAFHGGVLAEGFYADIKDRVKASGGKFTSNLYIAYKDDMDELAIGSLQFKGGALGAWMEWSKAHREKLYEGALEIAGYNEGKKGKVVFRTPKFHTKKISDETNAAAIALDKELQEYLKGYFARSKVEQVTPGGQIVDTSAEFNQSAPRDEDYRPPTQPEDDEIPF